MSSDEMRVDLESFVNEGLREGRQGWPLKSQLYCHHEGVRSVFLRAIPALAQSFRGSLERTLPEEGRFSRLFGCRCDGFLR
jgi:hypothetical protein